MKHKYFELKEFVASNVAKKRGIDNCPSFEVVEHLSELVDKILDPLRAAYGKPIFVGSGFRCEALNKAVGGVDTSAHKKGYAADLQSEDSVKDLFEFIKSWLISTKTKFDQLIIEKDKNGEEWVHLGMYNNKGQQRGEIKSLKV